MRLIINEILDSSLSLFGQFSFGKGDRAREGRAGLVIA
jgi:hypothetical protein